MMRTLTPLTLATLILACASAAIVACGPLVELPGSGPAPSLFHLEPIDAEVSQMVVGAQRPIVIVHAPEMPAALAIDRMAVTERAGEFRYLPGARWVENPPRLVQNFFSESLNNLGGTTAVTTDLAVSQAEYHLFSEITGFYVNAAAENLSPRVEIGIRLRLIRGSDNELLLSDYLTAEQDIVSVEPIEAVVGYKKALGEVVRDIDRRILSRIVPFVARDSDLGAIARNGEVVRVAAD